MADQEFFTLVTDVGRAKEARLKAGGPTIDLVSMALGDGNDEVYDPVEAQTTLRRERYRLPIASLRQDELNPHYFIAEATLPDEVGGFWIREVGLYDSDGDLYSIGKYPATYKPILSTGASSQLILRSIFVVSNTAAVTLMIDPSIVMASQKFVMEMIRSQMGRFSGQSLAGRIYFSQGG